MKNKSKLFGVLAIFALLAVPLALADVPPSKTYPANSVWFDPEEEYIEGCETIDVDVWINTSVAVAGFHGEPIYTPGCVNVTKFVGNTTNWGLFCEAGLFAGRVRITASTMSENPAGVIHIGTLTIRCEGTGDCVTQLIWDTGESYMEDPDDNELSAVTWHGSTFTCVAGAQPPCLGDCYNDTGALVAGNVPCYLCLNSTNPNGTWENYEFDSPCAPGTTVPRRSYDYCPECCDGVNNSDGDDLIDWPADPECACCLDETEAVDEGCPVECVPELPTLALAGIGILGIALLARKRD